eukprot:5752783-Prymnesium_polylepis.3
MLDPQHAARREPHTKLLAPPLAARRAATARGALRGRPIAARGAQLARDRGRLCWPHGETGRGPRRAPRTSAKPGSAHLCQAGLRAPKPSQAPRTCAKAGPAHHQRRPPRRTAAARSASRCGRLTCPFPHAWASQVVYSRMEEADERGFLFVCVMEGPADSIEFMALRQALAAAPSAHALSRTGAHTGTRTGTHVHASARTHRVHARIHTVHTCTHRSTHTHIRVPHATSRRPVAHTSFTHVCCVSVSPFCV